MPSAPGGVDVYVIPITGQIGTPNLYVLRRGLKEAIANEVEMVVLDMDTPGGRVDLTLEMMEMLDRFEGITATYVNDDAISAGSFIAASTDEIYFAPLGKIGASAVIQATGQDVPETVRLKIESYLRASIRAMSEDRPLRADVIRAMLDADFELKIGDEVIKPAGELLTLTASEAVREYGDPPRKLLGDGIYETVEELLDARFGPGGYTLRDFDLTYSEVMAKWMNGIAPALLGLGALLLFLEFKTPGFGIFGIAGLVLLAVFFVSQHIAGLAGNELIVFFALGVLLVLAEIFFFPGTLVFAISGILLMLGTVFWAMVDYWPGGTFEFSADAFAEPLVNLIFAVFIAGVGGYFLSKRFHGSWLERAMVLETAVGDDVPKDSSVTVGGTESGAVVEAGAVGVAVTDLYPSGVVEIDGRRYPARTAVGMLDRNTRVTVTGKRDFGLLVEELR